MKKINPILFFFLSILISGILIFRPALATDAALLPPGVQQFFDNSGNPLSSGKIYFYEVGTSTFKDTYTSSAATTVNTNPITLNAGGKAPTGGIYGIGLYRQLVKDRNGNTIWDAVTAPGGGGSTPTDVGDGNLVGTVLPWSGLVAPNQYVFAYGQEISRTTYPEFFTAVTQQANVICSAASNTLTGVSDTSQIPIGAPVELALCVVAGTTVVSKTASTVTLSNPSSVSINAVATFFPWGNGDGSTTFNVPDFRGYVMAGRTNMGGTASSNLGVYFSNTVSPNALGAIGGSQSHTLTEAEIPANISNSAISVSVVSGGTRAGTVANQVASAGASINVAPDPATIIVSTSTIVTINPLGGDAHSIVQPTITLNYVVKVTPDTSTSIATGVYSIGGMSGVISCGTGILCTGNIISFNGNVLANGSNGSLQFKNSDGTFGGSPNAIFVSPDNLTLGAVGTSFLFDIYGSTSGRVRQTVPAVAGTTNIAWGNASGTPAVTATTPIVLNSTTGDLTCPTCATGSLNGQALTRVDDTNVTLTLGGSPTTALLSPASLTLGWTGTLAAGRLNSNVVQAITNDTNVTGSILAQNLTLGWAGQLAVSRGGTGLNSGTSGGIPYFNSTSTMSSSALLATNQIMIGGGAGAGPSTFACATSTTVVHGGTPPTCSQIVAGDITTNTITNSNLSQTAASTLKGNPTASTANIQDFTIGSLTQTISPGATDWMIIYDNSTNTFKKVNATSIASSSVAGVATLNGLAGALTIANGQAIQAIGASGTTITISADVASVANFEAGTSNKLLDAATVFTAETTTTYGATTSFDFNTFINSKVTLTGNTTLTCSNIKAGQAGTIALIQDGTGTRVITPNSVAGWCSQFKFAGATVPTLTTSASAVDILSYSCRSSTYCAAALSKGYNP
jgi:hypothetical protein